MTTLARSPRPVSGLARCTRIAVVAGVIAGGCGGSTGQPPDGASGPDAARYDGVRVDSGPLGWHPAVTDTWQWQISGPLNETYDVDVYDIDLFDNDAPTIARLHAAGRAVVCYFSAGSGENWRDDYSRFLPSDLGNPLDMWPGERWLDVNSATVRAVMADRLTLARDKGCDGVEPDNVDGWTYDTGFGFAANDQIVYNTWLADQAHARGLRVALKNDIDQIPQLVSDFDFTVNEECDTYNECNTLQPFIAAGKPVFNAEYATSLAAANNRAATRCPQARQENLRTLILPRELDDRFRVSCD